MGKDLSVRDVMSTHLKTIDPGLSLEEVNDIFGMYHFHHLPVLSDGKLVGILSVADCIKVIEGINLVNEYVEFNSREILKKVTVEKIMTRNPFTIPPETSISEVAEILSKEKFHAIPVMEKGQLVGIISNHDINYYI